MSVAMLGLYSTLNIWSQLLNPLARGKILFQVSDMDMSGDIPAVITLQKLDMHRHIRRASVVRQTWMIRTTQHPLATKCFSEV